MSLGAKQAEQGSGGEIAGTPVVVAVVTSRRAQQSDINRKQQLRGTTDQLRNMQSGDVSFDGGAAGSTPVQPNTNKRRRLMADLKPRSPKKEPALPDYEVGPNLSSNMNRVRGCEAFKGLTLHHGAGPPSAHPPPHPRRAQ